MLAEILSSETRAAIFRLLFGVITEELHLREIQRRSGMKIRSIQVELARLANLGLITPRRSGNRLYYRANVTHPLFPEIRGLVRKTVGLVDVLRDALSGLPIRLAFVFGSIAAGEETARSDIDVLIIGPTTLRQVVTRLADIPEVTGREVNPIVFSESEFVARLQRQEHFVTRVLGARHLFILGNEDDLRELAQERLAEETPDQR